MTENEIPQPIQDLAKQIFGEESNYKLTDWDLDRIYIDKDDEDFTVRMWNISDDEIRWTLFKTIWDGNGGGHGEEMENGIFEYEVEPKTKQVSNFSLAEMENEMNKSKFVTLTLDFLKDEIMECFEASEEDGITVNLKDVNYEINGVEWNKAIQEYLSKQNYGVSFTFGDGNWTTIYKNTQMEVAK